MHQTEKILAKSGQGGGETAFGGSQIWVLVLVGIVQKRSTQKYQFLKKFKRTRLESDAEINGHHSLHSGFRATNTN